MHKRSQTVIGIRKREVIAAGDDGDLVKMNRSATAFDLRRHYAVKSLYTNSSTLYVKKKFTFRGVSARPLHKIGKEKTPVVQLKDIKSPYPYLEDDRPKQSLLTIIRIGIVFFGIELLFSLETALTVPILLQLKVPDNVYSLVWIISPLLGVLIQPILGIMSDRCESRFGRRRPFIAVLAFGAFIGISLILNSVRLGTLLGDKPSLKTPIFGIVITGLGVTLLDFCADSSDSPLRAFLLDVCNVDDQDTGLNIHAMLGGLGSALGFVLAAIDWKKTFFKHLGDEFMILFVISSVIFIVTLILTLTSVKEKQFELDESEDNERKPLMSNQTENGKALTAIPDELDDDTNLIDLTHGAKNNSPSLASASDIEEDEEDSDKPITINLLFKSMFNMPRELLFVMICQLFGWMSCFSLTFFITDFVGQAIYHGDPIAKSDTIGFQNYNHGVKMGCWCLLTNAVSSSVYAFILEKFLLDYLSTRFLYFIGCLINAILIGCIFFTDNIYVIMFLCSGTGILVTTLSTLPYQMLSEFHKDDNYRRKSAEGTKRGIGIDCSLLSTCFFLAQTLVASYSSPLIDVFGDYTIVVMSSIMSFVNCLWISLFMIFPKSNKQNSDKEMKQQPLV